MNQNLKLISLLISLAVATPPKFSHPAPLPITPAQVSKPGMKKIPPRPVIKINNVQNGIIVSWTVDALTPEHADIHSYQIYAYEVTESLASTLQWRHVGDVKALLLPMAVTLTQFQEGKLFQDLASSFSNLCHHFRSKVLLCSQSNGHS